MKFYLPINVNLFISVLISIIALIFIILAIAKLKTKFTFKFTNRINNSIQNYKKYTINQIISLNFTLMISILIFFIFKYDLNKIKLLSNDGIISIDDYYLGYKKIENELKSINILQTNSKKQITKILNILNTNHQKTNTKNYYFYESRIDDFLIILKNINKDLYILTNTIDYVIYCQNIFDNILNYLINNISKLVGILILLILAIILIFIISKFIYTKKNNISIIKNKLLKSILLLFFFLIILLYLSIKIYPVLYYNINSFENLSNNYKSILNNERKNEKSLYNISNELLYKNKKRSNLLKLKYFDYLENVFEIILNSNETKNVNEDMTNESIQYIIIKIIKLRNNFKDIYIKKINYYNKISNSNVLILNQILVDFITKFLKLTIIFIIGGINIYISSTIIFLSYLIIIS